MFYNIGQRTPSALTKYRIDDLISIDEGWAIHRNKDSFILYKGWADDGLQRKVEQQDFSAELGVYVIIHRTKDRIDVYRDVHNHAPQVIGDNAFGNDLHLIENCQDDGHPYRKFPCTEITQRAYWDIYTSTIKFEDYFDNKEWCKQIIKSIKFNSFDITQCAEAITEHIRKRLVKFYKQCGHKKTIIRPTGGYDATAIASIALNYNFDIEVQRPMDAETLAQREELIIAMSDEQRYPKYESYQTVKYTPNSNLLLGAMDNYTISEPWLCAPVYKDLYDQLIGMKDSYSYYQIFKQNFTADLDAQWKTNMLKKPYNPNRPRAIWDFMQTNINLIASWHWKDQLIFSPFGDCQVTALMLQVKDEFVPTMIMDKAVVRKITEINCPDLLPALNKSSKDSLLPKNLPDHTKKYFAN